MDSISNTLATIQAQRANDRQALSMIESAWAKQADATKRELDFEASDAPDSALAEGEIANIAELIASLLGGSLGESPSEGTARVVVLRSDSGDEADIVRQLREAHASGDEDEEFFLDAAANETARH